MPPSESSTLVRKRGRVGALSQHREANDPELIAARQDLAASVMEEQARRLVEKFPPLSDEQVGRIVSLLRGAVSVGAGSGTTGRQVTSPPGGGRIA